ncbi:WSSV051 [White spot syndrome virus]|uniref:WSSV051 n=1 Tax=White spot syndrome virus TaxID=342409 RepID=A0A2I6SBI1_9VIRU|nr:WSSV051 [White spot syndrome virus]
MFAITHKMGIRFHELNIEHWYRLVDAIESIISDAARRVGTAM